MDLTVVHSLTLLLLIVVFAVADSISTSPTPTTTSTPSSSAPNTESSALTAGGSRSGQCDVTCNPPGVRTCRVIKDNRTALLRIFLFCDSTSPSTTITSAPSGSGTNAESSSSTDFTFPTPTTTSTPSSSAPNTESSTLTAGGSRSVQCDVTYNPPGAISCRVIKNCCTALVRIFSVPPSDCKCHWEGVCNTLDNCRQQCPPTGDKCNFNVSCDGSWDSCTLSTLPHVMSRRCLVEELCGSTTTTDMKMSEDSTSPSTTITSAPSGSGTYVGSSSSTDSTSPSPTTASTPSGSGPNPENSTLTVSTSPTSTPSSSEPNPESSGLTESMTSNATSAAGDSPVEEAVVSCLAVVFVVVVVVAVFFWRRKRQANGVSKENNPICCSAATNLQHKQDSFHVYDKLSRENKRANIDNASTGAANSPDNDNNDDYTYIDGPAINKGVVRLHQDRPVTTAGEHALTDPSVSGLHSDLPSTYRLARVTDNDAPDSLPPDYFILEERDKEGCAEPTQYFILEEMGERKSAADTDSQQYFILEETQEGAGRESIPQRLSSRSEADYFVLENDDGQEPECADSARSDASRGPPEEAEYCRLDPNSRQESEYTQLTGPPQPPDTIGDNPYCLASYPE